MEKINNNKKKGKGKEKREKGKKGRKRRKKEKKGKKKGEKKGKRQEKRKKKIVFGSHRKISKTFLGKNHIFSPRGKNIIYFRDLNVFQYSKPVYTLAESFKFVRFYPLGQDDLPSEVIITRGFGRVCHYRQF